MTSEDDHSGPAPHGPRYVKYPSGDPNQKQVELSADLSAMLPALVIAEDEQGYRVELTLDVTSEGVRPVSVKVEALNGSPPVSGSVLRSVRVAEIFNDCWSAVFDYRTGESSSQPVAALAQRLSDAADPATRAAGARDDQWLTRVARLYEAADMAGLNPQKFIMEAFGAPRSTAGYWIASARKRGMLAPARRVQSDA